MIVTDAKELCFHLLHEIAFGYISLKPRSCYDLHETTAEEQEHIKRLYQPYMDQLPEYSDLIDTLFIDPFETY